MTGETYSTARQNAPVENAKLSPRTFPDTTVWLRPINSDWQALPPVDLHGSVEPNVVEASSGHTFVVTLRVGPELIIPTGAHITMELPASWDTHLGNTFRRQIRNLGNRQQIRGGYGAFTDVECSNPAARLAHEASYNRILDLLDVVVTAGEIGPGDELRLILGPEDGNQLQAQKFAQVAILTVGVDLAGDGVYRRAATHPTVKVIGAAPDRFRIFAPGVAQPGQPFAIRMLPVDIYSFNPAPRYRGTARIVESGASGGSAGLTLPDSVTIGEAQATGHYGMAPATITATAATSGIHAVTVVDTAEGLIGKSNPIGVGFLADRGVYFGEMHSQTWRSMGTGTDEEFFLWGRDVAGLDFCALANHYGMRFDVTPDVWREQIDTTNRFDDPGRFATLVSYEWAGTRQGVRSGHKNVYYRGAWGEYHAWFQGVHDTPEDLWRDLREYEALTVPHHTRATTGVDWSFRNDRYQRLVEICSNWGISERGGPHSVQAALALGHRIGFVGGTDSHYGLANQGSYHVNDGNGLACVQATDLSRDAIWQALYDRRCYATTGDRILVDFTLDGHPMGTDTPVDLATYGVRRCMMRVAGTSAIDLVEIVRNNQVVFAARPGADSWEEEWIDAAPLLSVALSPTFDHDRPFVFYYLRVTQANRQLAWGSPVWLTQRGAGAPPE